MVHTTSVTKFKRILIKVGMFCDQSAVKLELTEKNLQKTPKIFRKKTLKDKTKIKKKFIKHLELNENENLTYQNWSGISCIHFVLLLFIRHHKLSG